MKALTRVARRNLGKLWDWCVKIISQKDELRAKGSFGSRTDLLLSKRQKW